MNIILGATIDQLLKICDLTHRDVAWKGISGTQGNADVTISDDSKELSVTSHDRKKSAVPIPHQLRSHTQIHLWLATVWRSLHQFFNFHSFSSAIATQVSLGGHSASRSCPILL